MAYVTFGPLWTVFFLEGLLVGYSNASEHLVGIISTFHSFLSFFSGCDLISRRAKKKSI